MRGTAIRRFLLIAGLLTTLLLTVVIVALVILPHTESGKTFLLDQVKEHLGHDIHVKQFNVAVLPRPSLQLFDVEIKNITSTLEMIRAPYLDVEIYLLPLFFRTVIFKRLTLERPEVILRLFDDEETSLPPSGSTPSSPQTISFAQPLIEQLAIQQGTVTLRKKSESKTIHDLVIEDILMTLDMQSFSLPANFQIAAKKAKNEEGASTFRISGLIDHLPSKNYDQGNLWNNIPPIQIIGQADLSNFKISELKEFAELGPELEEFQAMINLTTQVILYPDQSGLSLAFSDLECRMGDVPIQGKGTISGLLGNATTFFTSFSSSPSRLPTIMSLLPPSLVPSHVQDTINAHELDGMVELVTSTITGSTSTDIGISTMGVLRVSQGHLLVNRHLPPVNNFGTSIVWDNNEVRLEHLSGEYQSSKIIDGQAAIQLRDSGLWANMDVTSKVDIKNVLSTWSVFSRPQQLPTALNELQGTGTISIKVQGQLNELESLNFEEIHVEEGNFLVFQDLAIHDVSGTFKLANNLLAVRDLKAEQGSSKILNAQGNIKFQPHGPWVNLEANTLINVQDIKTLMTKFDSTIEQPKALGTFGGEGHMRIHFKGPVNDPLQMVVEKIQLDQGRIHIHPDLSPIYPVHGIASYSNGILRVGNFNAAFRSSKIRDSSATIQFAENAPRVYLAINSDLGAKDVVELARYLKPIPKALMPIKALKEVDGRGQITLEVQGPLNNPEHVKLVSGNIQVEDITFRSPQVSKPIEHLTGRIMISEDELRIPSLSGQIGRSQAELRGTIPMKKTNDFQDVVLQGRVESRDINKIKPGVLPAYLQGVAPFKAVVFGRQDSPSFRVNIDFKEVELNMPEVIHKPVNMPTSFKGEGKFKNRRILTLTHANLSTPHLELFGKGTFDIGNSFAINTTVKTAPVSLSALPDRMFLGTKKFQSGDLTLELDIDGKGKDWREWDINGSAKLKDMVIAHTSMRDSTRNLSVDIKIAQERFETLVMMEKIPIKNILALSGTDSSQLEGDLSLKGTLQGKVKPNHDPIPTLHGNFNVLVNEGTIHPGEILSRILTFLNAPALLGGDGRFDQPNLPFNSISSDIQVAEGKLHTDNLVLNSSTLIGSAAGTHDLITEQLNIIVAVSPLGSYTNILKRIPLVNRIFGETGGKLLTAFFEVKGPIQDPQVLPLPFKSVEEGARGLIDLSLNALESASRLPEDVLQSLPQK